MGDVFKQYKTIFYYEPTEYVRSELVFGFDLDWTLTYNEKHLFPKEATDIYIFPNRKQILEKIIKDGYNIVIFTNQYAKTKKEKQNKVERLKTFIDKLNLPVCVYISTEKDNYRKPEIGMWNFFKKDRDIKNVIFVGDALGRPQDFSDSDRLFGEKINACEIKSAEDFFGSSIIPSIQNEKELIVFVGMPGSGKSTYYHKNLK
jgi:bifunctional polynucleotide phosphatase/kinase